MTKQIDPRAALECAIRQAGSQVALGKILGKRQSVVFGWLRQGRIAAEYVLKVEAATGVSRHDLRPDIYPRDLPPAPTGPASEALPVDRAA